MPPPIKLEHPGESRRCKAHSSRTKQPCKAYAIHGSVVCKAHGGGSPQVKRVAKERLLDLIDPDRVLREMARIAYTDTAVLFDEKGNVRPIKDWPEDFRRAVASVEVVKKNLTAGDGAVDEVLKIKLWDKVKTLEMLCKHLGLLTEKLEHTGGITIKHEMPD